MLYEKGITMKEKSIKRKYVEGDIIKVGNGISAEVIQKVGNKYMLEFSNGIKGLFTSASVESGMFRVEARYKDAVKDFGDGFTLRVIRYKRNNELLCQYCNNDEVIASGNLNRHEFDRLRNINYTRGEKIYYYGVEFSIKNIRLDTKMLIDLEYKPFGTVATVEVERMTVSIDKTAINYLLGNKNSTYITRDGKIISGTDEFDLTETNVANLIGEFDYNYKVAFSSKFWLIASEYKKEYLKLRRLFRKSNLVGEEFIFKGRRVRVIAIPWDDKGTYILRNIDGYERLFEVSSLELVNYFKRFTE